MNKYFSVEDYHELTAEGKSLVDEWIAANDLDPNLITLIESFDNGTVVVSGVPHNPNEMTGLADIKVIRTINEDTFPWASLPNFLQEISS